LLATTTSIALIGADARPVTVEVDVMSHGLPGVKVVGMASRSVTEAAQRVRSAIGASKLTWPQRKIVANLAPGALRKDGTHFDLPLALGILVGAEAIPADAIAGWVCIGELALDGKLRPIRGALGAALVARERGARGVVCPTSNAAEAALVEGVEVVPLSSLAQAVAFFSGTSDPDPIPPAAPKPPLRTEDLVDVRGQAAPRRALEIAAAGGHNLLMTGPPGGGKTMLARRLPGILPAMTADEALEVTRIYSIGGHLGEDASLITTPPFRSPHHTTSVAGLIGGGSGLPRPGEAVLAHRGVLFLDELSLFRRDVLEALRGPLEDRVVRLARADGHVTFPCDFSLVGAMNPCPCGHLGDVRKACKCREGSLAAHRARVSGPLLDRFDLVVQVNPLDKDELLGIPDGEPSAVVRQRVERARTLQLARYGDATTNARAARSEIDASSRLSTPIRARLARAIEDGHLSARGVVRTMRVARTIADLQGSEELTDDHVAQALGYRTELPTIGELTA
jgi:magnesium chelatase family protein